MSQSTQNNTNLTSKTVIPDDINGKTIMPDDMDGKTIMPDDVNSKTIIPDTINSKTILPDTQNTPGQSTYNSLYSLNGKDYKLKKVISANTGQAEILLVESQGKEYVLKLYFQGLKAEIEILQLIKNVNTSGMLVEIFDFGTWNDPVSLHKRDFVIMEYLGGGSMDHYQLNKDAAKFRDLALLMTACITACHHLGFIHLDIKPANFLFRDSKQSRVALCDFGTSAIFRDKVKKSCSTRQARTPVYASPDLYYSIGGVAEIDYKSDFYSLGISLICLWEGGEGWFRDNEIDLMRKKRAGSIPLPDDMPGNIKALINGLLLVDPANRWDEKQIIAWGKGEIIEVQHATSKKVDILFNAAKNMSFTNLTELVKCMMADEALAKKYLYSGKITRWLEDMQHPERAMEIEEICERRYPSDQDAGLWSAIYSLDAEMPYIDLDGKKLTTAEEISKTLLVNDIRYEKELVNPNHRLFLYLAVCGNDDLRKEMNFNFEYFNPHEALMCMVYSLNPNETFNLYAQQKQSNTQNSLIAKCKTIKELYPAVRGNQLAKNTENDILSAGFLGWIRPRVESNTYEAVKEIIYTANSVQNKKLATWVQKKINSIYLDPAKAASYNVKDLIYYILYILNPAISFDLYTQEEMGDRPRIFNVAEVAGYYNKLLIGLYQNGNIAFDSLGNNNDFPQSKEMMELLHIDTSRAGLYLKSKDWNNWIQWIKECMRINSAENTKKCGPYDYIIAFCKFVRAAGAEPSYYLTKANAYISSPGDVSKHSKDHIRYEMENGYLKSWLAAFYQEDPKANLKPKHTYEKLTEQYLLFIKNYEKSSTTVQRYEESKSKAAALLSIYNTVSGGSLCKPATKYILSAIFALLPVLLSLLVLFNHYNAPLLQHFPFGSLLAVWVVYCIAYTVANGFSFRNILRFKALLLLVGVFVLFFVTLAFLPNLFWWILGTALIAVVAYTLYLIFGKIKNSNQKTIDPFEVGTIEPLYYAFKDHKSNIRCSIEQMVAPLSTSAKQRFKNTIVKLLFMLALTVACGKFYLSYHPASQSALSIKGQNHRYLYTFPQKWFTTINGIDAVFEIGDIAGDGSFTGNILEMKGNSVTNTFPMSGAIHINTNTFEFVLKEKGGKLNGAYAGTINRNNNTMEGVFAPLNNPKNTVPFILFSKISTNTETTPATTGEKN